MLKIRLSRAGKKSQPSFRVVLQEHTQAAKGKFIEELGFYQPALTPKKFQVDSERIKYWISKGAKPSDTLASLLKRNGMDGMDKFLAPRNKQRKPKNPEAVAEAPAAPAAPAEAPVEAPAPAVEAAPEAPAEAPKETQPAAEEKPADNRQILKDT